MNWLLSKKKSNNQELIQPNPTPRPQNQKGNNQTHKPTTVYERHSRQTERTALSQTGGHPKFTVGLKTLLHQGLSEPEFYGDLVYKFKNIVGRVDFSDQFRKIIVRYKRIGYNINIMRQSTCLVFNPIRVNNFASLFNCTPVGRASDSMMAPT